MQNAPVLTRLPEDLSPEAIGAEMAKLRVQFGLSQQEVSERLHIRARYVAAIEDGKFDLMPGKVYARGYVQTYAEFLGLDPEQIIRLCFMNEGAVAAIAVHKPLPNVRATRASGNSHRGFGMIIVGVLALALIVSQFTGHDEDTHTEESTVAPVPEEMLETVRNLIMPTPGNKECLMNDVWLACSVSDETSHLITQLALHPFAVAGDIDVSSVELEPVIETPPEGENETPPEDAPGEDQAAND